MSSATQAIASSLALTPGRWAMDPNHSAITFSIRHLGLSKIRGRFRVFEYVFNRVAEERPSLQSPHRRTQHDQVGFAYL